MPKQITEARRVGLIAELEYKRKEIIAAIPVTVTPVRPEGTPSFEWLAANVELAVDLIRMARRADKRLKMLQEGESK